MHEASRRQQISLLFHQEILAIGDSLGQVHDLDIHLIEKACYFLPPGRK